MESAQSVLVNYDADLLKKITCYQCDNCLDSLVAITSQGYHACSYCQGRTDINYGPVQQLFAALQRRTEKNDFISVPTLKLARALVKGTAEVPIPAYALLQHLKLTSARTLKGMIESLRADWMLPIGSNREEEKSGYYWITTPEDALHWHKQYTAQARREFTTATRLIKYHYPELSGQLTFDYEEE